MKKLFLSLTAVVALLATSCVQDVSTDEAVSVGGEATVRFSVGAADLGSRAYATGVWADELYYAVYNQNGDLLPVSVLPGETPVALQNGAADLEVKLAAGLTYNFIFWAASTEALANGTYTFDWENQTMSLNPEKLVAQDETLDAFYLYVPNVEADGNATPIGVELKRPFAQVNVATSDTEAAAAAGLTVAQTQISIWAHTELNLVSGDVAGFNELTYKYANKAEGELKTGYDWLGMIYVLVDDYATVDVKFGYNTAVGANAVRVLNIPNVPVQRNHRTNIVGEVLTSGKNFDVNIDDEFAGDHEAGIITIGNNSYGTLSAAVAAAADGDQLTLQGDITIGANEPVTTIPADKSIELNLNGKTITATVGDAASLLSRATGNINLFDVRGELTIKGGDIKLKYEGEDMGWNYFSEIFYVGFNGKLTIEDSMLENLGGTAMSYVVDMVNATNTTVIIKNSTLKSTYIPFRVFNNAKNGVNNVTIENSTLEGKYAFWVQYYLGDGRDEATLATNLNFDIFGNGNTYVSTAKPEAPIMYGFDAYYYFDGNGTPVIYDQAVLAYAFGAYTSVKLGADINLDSALAFAEDKTFTLDLNGKTLTAVAGEDAQSQVGKNEFMFTVTKGSLNLKNGAIIYEYKGENMAWNNCTAIFNITDGGEVNLSGVTAKNLGGTDMNFVAHLNNWGEVTLNVDNSTLEATYVAVRVFNSGNDMNNVTIKNTTLKGGRCFWVHNYTLADFGNDQSKVDAHKALLNLDILNGTNTFVPAEGKAPIRYGFTNSVYYDANGNEWINAGASKDTEGNYHISSAEGLRWVAEEVNSAAAQAANLFDNVTVYLENDIDLGGEAWTPIGDYAFSRTVFRGVFDGQDHTISNFNVAATTRTDKVAECPYGLFGNVSGTIKNLKVDHAVVAPEGGRFAGVLAGRLKEGAVIDNCHISNSEVTISHWQVGGIAGQVNDADIKNSSISYSTITGYAGVGAIAGFLMVAGEYDIENCEVKECSLVQNGSFGGNYDTMYGLAVGTINNGSVVCNINDIKIEGNTIMGNASETLVGYIEEGAKLYVDGGIASVAAFKAAVATKEAHIKLAIEVDLADIILSGHNGTIEGVSENAALNTRNFTPSADEAYQLRSTSLTFKNLDIKLPTDIDWIKSGFVGTGTIVFDNCDFEGQATLNGSATWIFNDCDFVSTVTGCYASFVYGATKATFNRCTFGGVDRAAKVYGTGGVLDVEYNTCKYTSTTLNKNGVEIDASYATTTVNLNNCEQTAMAGLYALKGTKGTVYVNGVQQ